MKWIKGTDFNALTAPFEPPKNVVILSPVSKFRDKAAETGTRAVYELQVLPKPKTRTSVAGLVAVLLLFAGCDHGKSPPENPPVDDLNVVFVILDAGAAPYFGCYGAKLPTSPNIDAFAKDATVFERAYSQATTTLPSTSSFLTGKYLHGKYFESKTSLKLAEKDTLAAVLKRAGLRTAAFTQNPFVTHQFGFATGFDEFQEFFPARLATHTWETVDSKQTVAKIDEWLGNHEHERFFVYAHLLPPHAPYDPPAPFSERFSGDSTSSLTGSAEELIQIEAGKLSVTTADLEHLRLLYQQNVAYGDDQFGAILDAIKRRGLLEKTLVILAADHGEAFGEHGHVSHGPTLYETVIHVPLIIRFPARFGTLPRRWPGVVELRQVFPTVLDTLHVPGPMDARSLLAVLRDGEGRNEGTALSRTRDEDRVPLRTLVTKRFKLIASKNGNELYDLKEDPGEKHDLSAAQPNVVVWLERGLQTSGDGHMATDEVEIDDATREKLRALGYTDP